MTLHENKSPEEPASEEDKTVEAFFSDREQINEQIFHDNNDFTASQKPSIQAHIKEWLQILFKIVIIGCTVFIIINILTNRFKIDGASMEPTLQNNSYIIIDKITPIFKKPNRGDIIIFYRNNKKNDYIKRVIGLPGDTIEISKGKIYINGLILDESYIKSKTIGNITKHLIDEDEHFVMGDNRIGSKDSRNFGAIHSDEIIGYARIVYWPPKNWSFISHIKYKMRKIN